MQEGWRFFATTAWSTGDFKGTNREDPEWTIEGYRHWRADVTDEAQVAKMFGQIRAEFGRLDVAISNAGIASMNHALLMPATTAARIMNVNFIGSFLVCREAAKPPSSCGGGISGVS
jgi:3-oxoacyl-[acyl-carrier protein] reductase